MTFSSVMTPCRGLPGDIPRFRVAHVQVSHGPMEIGVQLEGEEKVLRKAPEEIPEKAKALLREIQGFQPVLRMPGRDLRVKARWPRVVRRMVEAVRKVSGDLTPMAAVAGAVADEILLEVREVMGPEMLKILVNNGGDMALYSPCEPVRVGIRGTAGAKGPMRELEVLERDNPFGVATSGWRGRSFSQGFADAVVVVAPSAAIADAAATHIGNHVTCDCGKKVVRKRASEIDPMTDIPDVPVTVSCGLLDETEKRRALRNGSAVASALSGDGIVWATGIYLQGEAVELAGGIVNFK